MSKHLIFAIVVALLTTNISALRVKMKLFSSPTVISLKSTKITIPAFSPPSPGQTDLAEDTAQDTKFIPWGQDNYEDSQSSASAAGTTDSK